IDVPSRDSSSLSSAGSQKDLNSSSNLERDISGEYNIEDQADISQPEPGNSGAGPVSSRDKFDSTLVTPQAESSSTSDSDVRSGIKSLDQSLNSSAVGGPGSTETGVASSSEENKYDRSRVSSENEPFDNSQTSRWSFQNNRAQGVGSAVTGEF